MKKMFKIISIFLLILMSGNVFGQTTTHISQETGFWDVGTTWVNGNLPNKLNHMIVNIMNPHLVTVNGDLVLNNNITINVEEGAGFLVNGDVIIGKNNQQPFTFEINGTASITGDLSGYGSVVGDGNLYVGCDIGSNIDTTLFRGRILHNNPYPIELLSFEAKQIGVIIELKWVTLSETNNNYFTIEKSYDMNYWEIVSQIKGAGDSNRKLKYVTRDNNPHTGIIYYRLTQTDFDGRYEIFTPISINYSTIEEIHISKIHNEIIISIMNEDNVVEIFDMGGRLIYREHIGSGVNKINLGRYNSMVVFVVLKNRYNTITKKIY